MLSFLYNFIFIDQEKGHLSHTKFWSHVGYIVMIGCLIYAQITGKALSSDLYFFFGSMLIGNRTILKGIGVIKGNNIPTTTK